ncbi:MAG: hypothetical protein ACXWCG_08375, partial [Flavitalea sp.]
ASQMPLRLASFHGSTWDYTLYSEGFLAPFTSNDGLHDTVSSFISIDELIDHKVLDPTFVSIPEFVKQKSEKKELAKGKISPLDLADSLEIDSEKVLGLVMRLRPGQPPTLMCEIQDLETWAYLSKYFSFKLRAGVALHTFRTTGEKAHQQIAVKLLRNCVDVWKKIGTLTSGHYQEVPYIDDHSSGGNAYKDARKFSWIKYLPQVERDVMLAQSNGTR